MEEVKYWSTDIDFVNPVTVRNVISKYKKHIHPPACYYTSDCPGIFTYEISDVQQSIEYNKILNKVSIGYWVPCPTCKRLCYVGGIS